MADPAVHAYLEQLDAYFNDPGQAPHKHPPRPPSSDVAIEVGAAAAAVLAYILEYQKTGQLPDHEPSVQTKLEVANMIDEVRDGKEAEARIREAFQQSEKVVGAQRCSQSGGGGGQHRPEEVRSQEDVQDVGDRPPPGG